MTRWAIDVNHLFVTLTTEQGRGSIQPCRGRGIDVDEVPQDAPSVSDALDASYVEIHYVTPIGGSDDYVERALRDIAPFLDTAAAAAIEST